MKVAANHAKPNPGLLVTNIIDEQASRTAVVHDHHIHVAIVVDIPECRASPYLQS